jgi:Protein of unknown function (DUF3168)
LSADSSWALQQAVYAALAAAPAVKALIGDPARLFDHVPAEAAFPYLCFGSASAADWSTKSFAGCEAEITLHAWSRARGAKEAKLILAAVHAVLHDAALAVPGHNLALLRFRAGTVLLDEDGLTWHGVARYRALTHL